MDAERDQWVYADSAYKSAAIEEALVNQGIASFICEKGKRGAPLTVEQQSANSIISFTRVRVEHVFGDMTNSMKAMRIRCIGMARAAVIDRITSLTT